LVDSVAIRQNKDGGKLNKIFGLRTSLSKERLKGERERDDEPEKEGERASALVAFERFGIRMMKRQVRQLTDKERTARQTKASEEWGRVRKKDEVHIRMLISEEHGR
jgi:hypothetical protein